MNLGVTSFVFQPISELALSSEEGTCCVAIYFVKGQQATHVCALAGNAQTIVEKQKNTAKRLESVLETRQ